jgi:Transcriptional regulator C-terminal region
VGSVVEEIWDELTRENPFPQAPAGELSLDATRETVLGDFEHLAKHAAFYRVMVGRNGVAKFRSRMREYVYRTSEERLKPLAARRSRTDVPLEIPLQFMASSYVGLMQWWLENDMPSAPPEMAEIVVRLYDMSPFETMGLRTGGNPGSDQPLPGSPTLLDRPGTDDLRSRREAATLAAAILTGVITVIVPRQRGDAAAVRSERSAEATSEHPTPFLPSSDSTPRDGSGHRRSLLCTRDVPARRKIGGAGWRAHLASSGSTHTTVSTS